MPSISRTQFLILNFLCVSLSLSLPESLVALMEVPLPLNFDYDENGIFVHAEELVELMKDKDPYYQAKIEHLQREFSLGAGYYAGSDAKTRLEWRYLGYGSFGNVIYHIDFPQYVVKLIRPKETLMGNDVFYQNEINVLDHLSAIAQHQGAKELHYQDYFLFYARGTQPSDGSWVSLYFERLENDFRSDAVYDQIAKMLLPERLRLYLDIMRHAFVLHAAGVYHCDIKRENIMTVASSRHSDSAVANAKFLMDEEDADGPKADSQKPQSFKFKFIDYGISKIGREELCPPSSEYYGYQNILWDTYKPHESYRYAKPDVYSIAATILNIEGQLLVDAVIAVMEDPKYSVEKDFEALIYSITEDEEPSPQSDLSRLREYYRIKKLDQTFIDLLSSMTAGSYEKEKYPGLENAMMKMAELIDGLEGAAAPRQQTGLQRWILGVKETTGKLPSLASAPIDQPAISNPAFIVI